MAADANIQKIEELAAYSSHLGSFMESMSKNFTSFNNVMMQKLQVLRQKRKKAEEQEAAALKEYWDTERTLAYCSPEDVEQRRELLAKLKEAEHKKNNAKRMRTTVSTQYGVAQGAARCMADLTQTMQTKLRNNVSKGRKFLKNNSTQLEQYKDNSKKV